MQNLYRHLAVPLHRAMQDASVVALTGPRRSGKAELARREFPGLTYVSLAAPSDRQRARTDPEAFLGALRGKAIIDEAQLAPELLSCAGSAATSLLLIAPMRLELQDVPELHLFSLSLAERQRRPQTSLLALAQYEQRPAVRSTLRLETVLEQFHDYSRPPLAGARGSEPSHARHDAGGGGGRPDEDALERDTRTLLKGMRDNDRFLRFVETARAGNATVVDQSEWARLAGVTHTTIGRWLGVLERCFYIVQPRAFEASFGTRMIRRRKLYFLDPAWAPAASRFESWGVGEIVKSFCHAGRPAMLSHWATATGRQTSVIVEEAEGPVSVSFTRLPGASPVVVASARIWRGLAPHHSACIITTGDEQRLERGVAVRPWLML